MHYHDAGCFVHTFLLSYSMRCYAYYACSRHPLTFFASLYACLHVHAWFLLSSVSSILQHNEAMDIRSKPTFVPSRNHLLFVCLFACLLAFSFICASCLPYLLSHSMLAMSIMFIRFMPFHMLFASFPSLACVLVSCLCLCIYTHGARTCGARAQSPRHKQRGRDRKHVDISQVAAVSRFRSLAFFPLVMYSFKKPLLPLLFLP